MYNPTDAEIAAARGELRGRMFDTPIDEAIRRALVAAERARVVDDAAVERAAEAVYKNDYPGWRWRAADKGKQKHYMEAARAALLAAREAGE